MLYGCACICHRTKIAIPSTPATIGPKVAADAQAYWVPPHEIPTRRLVMPPTNRSAPVQSMCRRRSASGKSELSLASERTKHSAATKPTTQKGKLMWKHQRHEALSTSEPPSTGPMMLPMDQEPSTMEK